MLKHGNFENNSWYWGLFYRSLSCVFYMFASFWTVQDRLVNIWREDNLRNSQYLFLFTLRIPKDNTMILARRDPWVWIKYFLKIHDLHPPIVVPAPALSHNLRESFAFCQKDALLDRNRIGAFQKLHSPRSYFFFATRALPDSKTHVRWISIGRTGRHSASRFFSPIYCKFVGEWS